MAVTEEVPAPALTSTQSGAKVETPERNPPGEAALPEETDERRQMMERLATGPLERWAYAERMPVIPLLEVGLSPLLQWIVVPPLIVWLVRRQLT